MISTKFLFALLCVVLATLARSNAQAVDPCAAYATCSGCFEANNCGWCVSAGACLSGGDLGPNNVTACPGLPQFLSTLWYVSKSQVISSKAGFPVQPLSYDIYLKQGSQLKVPIYVTSPLPTNIDLDLMFVQDSSGSMSDDIDTFRDLAASLTNAVLAQSKSVQIGLASFIEKACLPQGYSRDTPGGILADGTIRNYGYKLDQPLSASAVALEAALFKLSATGNYDLPEAAFEALGQVLTCNNINWRSAARKIVLVTSDAQFHYRGDGRDSCTNSGVPQWDGLCYAEGATNIGKKFESIDMDYPSRQQIADLFLSRNMIPVFAIAGSSEFNAWDSFRRNYIGTEVGVTVALTSDSSNLVTLIVEALAKINGQIGLNKFIDAQNHVQDIKLVESTPKNAAGDVYINVPPGTTKEFEVTLLSSGAVVPHSITLRSPGFGDATLNIFNTFPCNDCNGLSNGNAKWDLCNVCDGTNACVGCDGVAFSNKVKDQCDVCDGTNECLNTECPMGQTLDQCGVCNGNNLCVGCDGVPFSLAIPDACGVCNGANECFGCDNVKYADKAEANMMASVDACGICKGNGMDCLGCDGIYYPNGGKKVVDQCGVCGGNNACKCDLGDPHKTLDLCGQCLKNGTLFPNHPDAYAWNFCVGCDGIAYPDDPSQRPVWDLCGKCGGSNECVSPCDGIANSTFVKDKCGICGGNGSECDMNVTITGDTPNENVDDGSGLTEAEAAVLGIVLAVAGVLCLGAILVAAFFIYKKHQNPYWMVPSGLLDNMNTGIADNPLYAGEEKWATNALSQ